MAGFVDVTVGPTVGLEVAAPGNNTTIDASPVQVKVWYGGTFNVTGGGGGISDLMIRASGVWFPGDGTDGPSLTEDLSTTRSGVSGYGSGDLLLNVLDTFATVGLYQVNGGGTDAALVDPQPAAGVSCVDGNGKRWTNVGTLGSPVWKDDPDDRWVAAKFATAIDTGGGTYTKVENNGTVTPGASLSSAGRSVLVIESGTRSLWYKHDDDSWEDISAQCADGFWSTPASAIFAYVEGSKGQFVGLATSGGGGSGPALSDADPADVAAVADPGTSPDASRADHVHAGATVAEGALAATAVQPGDLPAFGDIVTHDASEFDPVGAAADAQTAAEVFAVAADNALAAGLPALYQPLDSDLTAIAALSTTSYGRALLMLADAAAGRTAFGLGTSSTHPATDFDAAGAAAAAQAASQPLDSDLTAIAALTTTSYGRAFLALADAAALRTAGGLVIGTDVEAHDSDLTAIAGLTPTNDDVIQRKAGVWTNRTIAQLVTDLGLSSVYQPLDSDLTAIAALTTTSYGRAFLALADAAAARTALSLGTAATSASTDFQPIDSDLTAIAALTTTSYGRAVLALADAAALRTAAGLVIGTDVEAHDTDLTTIAGLTPTNDDFIQRKAGAWANRTVAQVLTDLGLGALYQPLDSDLTAIAALTTTSFGRSVLALADAAALRTLAGLGSLATLSTITTTEITDGTIATADLADAAITLAKMANMATASLLGRNTAGTGVPEVLSASTVRTLLSLVIGTNVQAWDADLDTLAGLTATTDNMIQSVGSAWASRTPAQVRTALALVIGTNVQAWDADLDALAGLTTAADALPYFTGSHTAAVTTLSSFIRTLLDDADAATARTTIGAGVPLATDPLADAKGDLFAGTANDTIARVAVSATDGLSLHSDSTATPGVSWGLELGGFLGIKPLSGEYLSVVRLGGPTAATMNVSLNTVYYVPMYVGVSLSVSTVGLTVNTLSAGKSAQLGIYKALATTGRPGDRLLNAGTVSVNSAASVEVTLGANQALTPGLYWLAVLPEANCGFAGQDMGAVRISANTLGGTTYYSVLTESATYPTLPTTANTTLTSASGRTIDIRMKVV